MLVRTWNAAREKRIRELVELVTADRPGVVMLQEVPKQASGSIGEWSGMKAFVDREETGFRSATSSVVLVPSNATEFLHKTITLNTNVFCEEQGRRLGLDEKTTREWEKPRRICQVIRVAFPNRRHLVVANVHCSTRPDGRMVDAELRRALNFVERQVELNDILVFTGWYELGGTQSESIAALLGRPRESLWHGLQNPFPMLVVLGAQINGYRTWPNDERTYDGKLLSSYPPVEIDLAADLG
ncbi:MAG TPA: hypothetical protein VGL76_03935 [Gaiellaceae bacterium]|jgi:hypothetical protein